MKKVIKLSRDHIVEIAEKNGFTICMIDKAAVGGDLDDNTINLYVADEVEYRQRLRDKLQEEVDEYLAEDWSQSNENVIVELTDIIEVVYALAKLDGASPDQLEAIRKKKAQERGVFEKRLIMEYYKK